MRWIHYGVELDVVAEGAAREQRSADLARQATDPDARCEVDYPTET
jgi:hypothetical protein